MTVSLRDQLVDAFLHAAKGTGGFRGGARYTRSPSGQSWWARKEPVSAREAQVAAQQQHTVDTVFLFAMEALPSLTPDGLLRHEGQWYAITGVLPNRMMQSVTVHAIQRADEPNPADVVE